MNNFKYELSRVLGDGLNTYPRASYGKLWFLVLRRNRYATMEIRANGSQVAIKYGRLPNGRNCAWRYPRVQRELDIRRVTLTSAVSSPLVSEGHYIT